VSRFTLTNLATVHSIGSDSSWGNPPSSILWWHPEFERTDRNDPDLAGAMPGITLVLIGRTPGAGARWTRSNVLCIDTGVHVAAYGHLSIAEVQTGDARLHRFCR